MLSVGLMCAVVGVATLWGSCKEHDTPAPAPVIVTTELTMRWDLFPHRISLLELTLSRVDAHQAQLEALCDGGEFGLIDVPRMRYGFMTIKSAQLVSREFTIDFAIGPDSAVDGVSFAAVQTLTSSDAALLEAETLTAFVRGFSISTDNYSTPPPFQTDPDIAYDPGRGYTTQGLSIQLGRPRVENQQVLIEVAVRNTLGAADRADMNAAIPLATTWMRVDLVVVGVTDGGRGAETRAQTSYDLSYPQYGTRTVQPHADPGLQQITVAGQPERSHALIGLCGFEIWANVDGRHDPACTVVQDELNSEGEPVSGPGRYVRELSVRLWDHDYEPTDGLGRVKADVYLSNSSEYKEVGNLCLRMGARVSMLQFDDPGALIQRFSPLDLELESEVPTTRDVSLNAGSP
jgi:hypothetical protein